MKLMKDFEVWWAEQSAAVEVRYQVIIIITLFFLLIFVQHLIYVANSHAYIDVHIIGLFTCVYVCVHECV